MKIGFSWFLILTTIVHLLALSAPIMSKIVVNLNIKESQTINVKLVAEKEESFIYVETKKEGVAEEVDTKFISDVTQKVDQQTANSENFENSNQEQLSLKDLQAPTTTDNGSNFEKNSQSEKESVGGAGPLFFDEEIAEGEKTSLNTIEYKYSSFYKRMKDQVGNTWIPMVSNLSSDQISPGTHRTRILLKINQKGEIIGIKLDEGSGTEILDQIAYQTFLKVRIFQNPPIDMFNGKDYLYIPWTLELRN